MSDPPKPASVIVFRLVERWPEAIVPYPGAGPKDGRYWGSVATPDGVVWVEEGDLIVTMTDGSVRVIDGAHAALVRLPIDADR